MDSTIVNLNAAAADFDGTNDRAVGEPAPVEVAGDLRNIYTTPKEERDPRAFDSRHLSALYFSRSAE
jgi:hypothetical protein